MANTLTKADIERMCRNAGMAPERRATIAGHEVFVADGFSAVPHVTYCRFGAGPGEFPDGAHCTIWFAAKGEEGLDFGRPLLFEKNHDPELEGSNAKHARINRALQDAREILTKRDQLKREGTYTHARLH